MTKNPEEGPAMFGITTGIEITKDGTAFDGHVFAEPGATDAEIKEAVAEVHGSDPSEIVLEYPGGEGKSSGGRRSFGFNNWNGSKWEPKGPKGNPHNN